MDQPVCPAQGSAGGIRPGIGRRSGTRIAGRTGPGPDGGQVGPEPGAGGHIGDLPMHCAPEEHGSLRHRYPPGRLTRDHLPFQRPVRSRESRQIRCPTCPVTGSHGLSQGEHHGEHGAETGSGDGHPHRRHTSVRAKTRTLDRDPACDPGCDPIRSPTNAPVRAPLHTPAHTSVLSLLPTRAAHALVLSLAPTPPPKPFPMTTLVRPPAPCPRFPPPHGPASPTVSSASATASALNVRASTPGPWVEASTRTRHRSPARPNSTRAP